jgi:hypothetical protein
LWDNCPYGVVSLLDMLEFYAKDYVQIAHQFGLILGTYQKDKTDPESIGKALADLLASTFGLGLLVTRDQIGEMLSEMFKVPGAVTVRVEKPLLRIEGENLDPARFCHHIESIYSVFRSELGSINFRAVPKEKSKYCDPKWLFDSPIQQNFPSAWGEFQSAGKCYAYGENTACAFHLNRALEWALKSLAVHLGKRFDRNSWERHLEDIDKELTARYTDAKARTPEEKFYSEAATQFGNMKVAWRNPTMHIEAHYDETQAAYLLTTVEQFMAHLANNNLREGLQP